jgi:cytochrome c oxidase subunit III
MTVKTGTIYTADNPPQADERRTRSRLASGGTRGGNGGSRGPGGGGGDRRPPDDDADLDQAIRSRSRILTGFLLVVVMMTFGGLVAAYIVIATNNAAEWRPFELPLPVWISTMLIVVSSLTYHVGKLATDRNDHMGSRRWFMVTTALGAAFISSQLLAWVALVSRGSFVAGDAYAGFFYVLTAVHALHVLGGIIALGTVLLRSWFPALHPQEVLRRQTLAQVVGWYWHFMGAIWMALFVLLGFWK